VSYPTPTYYSHLSADRARRHHNTLEERGVQPNRIKEMLEEEDINIMYFI
jgi:hypothetical protein